MNRVNSFASSLLTQPCDQPHHLCGLLSQLYTAQNDGSELPTEEKLVQCVKDMFNFEERVPIYIIVDAVDEFWNSPFTSSPRGMILKNLMRSHSSRVHNSSHKS
jgi:hypothetical protein